MIDTVLAGVEDELARYFAAAKLRAGDYGEHYVELWDQLERAGAGGKRARPALVLAAHDGLGGTDPASAMQLAIAFELLHTAFIIHDDLIDGDEMRRGVSNVQGAFRTRAVANGADARTAGSWAEAAAVLAGDLALSHAHRIVAQLDVAAGTRARLLDILDRVVFVSAAGELRDVTNTIGDVDFTVPDVLSTLEQKTAVYSCSAPLEAGGVLAGASDDDVAALVRFGRLAGIAFQLTDDLLGVFGDERVTGKSTVADLREGKLTTLIAHARGTASWERIAGLVGNLDITDEEARTVRDELVACGAVAETERLAAEHAALARAELSASGLPAALQQQLAGFGDRAVQRIR